MLGIRCVGVWGCPSDDPFVCFRAKPTQRACARDLPRDRKRKGKEGPRDQSAGEVSQEKDTVSRREEKGAVSWRKQSREQGSQHKSERRLLEPVDLGRVD